METLTVGHLIALLEEHRRTDYVFLKDGQLYFVPREYHDVPDREIPQVWKNGGTYYAPDVDVMK